MDPARSPKMGPSDHGAVAEYSGATNAGLARAFADDVYRTLRTGRR